MMTAEDWKHFHSKYKGSGIISVCLYNKFWEAMWRLLSFKMPKSEHRTCNKWMIINTPRPTVTHSASYPVVALSLVWPRISLNIIYIKKLFEGYKFWLNLSTRLLCTDVCIKSDYWNHVRSEFHIEVISISFFFSISVIYLTCWLNSYKCTKICITGVNTKRTI